MTEAFEVVSRQSYAIYQTQCCDGLPDRLYETLGTSNGDIRLALKVF